MEEPDPIRLEQRGSIMALPIRIRQNGVPAKQHVRLCYHVIQFNFRRVQAFFSGDYRKALWENYCGVCGAETPKMIAIFLLREKPHGIAAVNRDYACLAKAVPQM